MLKDPELPNHEWCFRAGGLHWRLAGFEWICLDLKYHMDRSLAKPTMHREVMWALLRAHPEP